MNLKDLFEFYDSEDDEEFEIYDETGEDFSDDFEDHDFMFNPNTVSISDTAVVDLVKDGTVIRTSQWADMYDWLDDNWESLSGTYNIAERGMVLHSFSVAF